MKSEIMLFLIVKDKRRRALYNLFENYRKVLTALFLYKGFSNVEKREIFRHMIYLPKDSSITRIRNRCVLTGRPRAVSKRFGLSRLMIRKYLWRGALLGFRNSSF